jgi:glycosyltransferase involved in cell wall biosynthesis
LRLAVVGVSVNSICGVRDHSLLLAEALEREGISCSLHWLARSAGPLPAARAQVRSWARSLTGELRTARADVVLLAYSVFDYSHRGIPLFVAPVVKALRGAGIPVLAMVHEPAYPWTLSGLRGKLWALTQRAALRRLLRTAGGAIVTADFQARWLGSRRWLPQRPLLVAPVYSNLPPPSGAASAPREHALLGVFGYSYEGVGSSLVLDALRLLREQGTLAQLRLLGAPGRSSASGQAWLQAASERGVAQALSFSGPLPAQALSDELAGCDVLLFADLSGPTSRKGSLAGALASGRPVIALDGSRTWSRLRDARAAELVPARPDALARAVGAVLVDRASGEALGARGQAFHDEVMGVSVSARAVMALAEELTAQAYDGERREAELQVARASR